MKIAQPIIVVSHLSKQYEIGRRRGGYVALRDILAGVIKNPVGTIQHRIDSWSGKTNESKFWALKDINFTINKGDAVGIIGANGSGKSTLLKILTKVTTPTTGQITLRGRISSLLEVGTGFHPELTGRENIFLNGAILGMTQKEIRGKMDAIVEFSGVDKFIDTPVKHYSSGMYVRLAFAVAAHMEPDILIVDEVLAVGDAAFQKKCLGKMDEVTKVSGRTILFVSHNMTAIQNLCNKCILLEQGKVKAVGETKVIIKKYLESIKENGVPLADRNDRKYGTVVKLTSFKIEKDGKAVSSLKSGEDYEFCLSYKSINGKPLKNTAFWAEIYHESGLPLFQLNTNFTNQNFVSLPPVGTVKCSIQSLPLASGYYSLSAVIKSGDSVDIIREVSSFEVKPGKYFGHSLLEEKGQVFVKHDWKFKA